MWIQVSKYQHVASLCCILTVLVSGTLSVTEFLRGLGKWSANLDKEPSRWTFGTLERLPTGSFKDSDLVKILQDGTEHVAGLLSGLLL
jgi:hypothetical protein